MEINILPVVYSCDKNGLTQRVNPRHTEQEWKKLIDEMKDCTKIYDQIYGMRVDDIVKLDEEFIRVSITIVDEETYFEYGDLGDADMVFVGFINHDLYCGSYPSFYQNNLKRSLTLDHFVSL